MNTVNIRVAQTKDIHALVEFNQLMAFETEQKKLDKAILNKGVSALISDKQKGFYLVAEQGEHVVASLMVTTEWSDWRNGAFWWIQSVYVTPNCRRKGIYAKLYGQVKKLAETENICGFRLYVENDNQVAQQTYSALGMKQSHYLMFEE